MGELRAFLTLARKFKARNEFKNAGAFIVKRDYEAWAYILAMIAFGAVIIGFVYTNIMFEEIRLEHCLSFIEACF